MIASSLLFGAAAAWGGCSDDASSGDAPDTTPDAGDAGVDAAKPPPVDAGYDAPRPKRDCSNDTQADGLTTHLECTGLYDDFGAKTVAAANLAYTPALQFWSDGAEKHRWMYLPPNSKIGIGDFDAWVFPDGTKVWKEFKIDGKRIETRLFMKAGVDWIHTTYRWNDDESDAVRKDGGEMVALAGRPPYEVPSTGQCANCHQNRAEELLGIDAVSLGLPGAEGATLASLAAAGKLSAAPPATALAIPDDGTTKAAAGIGWLHANCSACHAPGSSAAGGKGSFQLRGSQLVADGGATAKQLDVSTTMVCVQASRPNPDGGVAPIFRIAGGDPTNSLAAILSGERAPAGVNPGPDNQMPPLVTHMVDAKGHALLTDWIAAMPACP